MTAPSDVELTERGAHLHSMSGSFTHTDGRVCGWHQRLREHIVLSDPAHGPGFEVWKLEETYRCLRPHHDVPSA